MSILVIVGAVQFAADGQHIRRLPGRQFLLGPRDPISCMWYAAVLKHVARFID